jgi:hypothetical protein
LIRIRVYVYSSAVSALGFVDKEGAQHACAQTGGSAFAGLQHHAGMSNRYLSDGEKSAIIAVEAFCKTRGGFDYEVVDLALEGYFAKAKCWLKGLRNLPAVALEKGVICGVPTEEDMKKLVAGER